MNDEYQMRCFYINHDSGGGVYQIDVRAPKISILVNGHQIDVNRKNKTAKEIADEFNEKLSQIGGHGIVIVSPADPVKN